MRCQARFSVSVGLTSSETARYRLAQGLSQSQKQGDDSNLFGHVARLSEAVLAHGALTAAGLRPCSVWILGNSFITSVLERVSQLPDGRQLGFRCSKAIIRWLGHNNLRWASVIPTVSRYAKEDGPPDILVVHAGESDLASTTINNLTQYIQGVLLKLRSKFPGAVVVWSQMVYRCKTQPKISQKRLDRACIKINNNVSKYVSDRGVACIKHQGLFGDSPHLFSRSGLSLTSAGKDICRTDIRKGIEKAIQRWKKSHGINA
ncbi:hypothetical protein GDO78_012948 [Eleutherodactylus coqui]|uniref:SGNH hydrolase-type esterase domain-containing protein n=1 Tax=Eleutherodactylus coqui TaxID=57060 RepID=A0A8J6EYW7_ELECQ|nr:hypothetical protein GDO78_012948 [Eleutherodactylus coqui]